ncbi:endonuclease, partial [bacterium]|nr:endonuclease [bacterium]
MKLKHRKKRGAQVVVVDSPEGKLLLVGWHLGLKEKQRHAQVNHLLDHVDLQDNLDLPTLIVGDFNDWRNTLADGPFAKHGFE